MEELEEKWFWETEDIYDLQGDLLIWSLLGVLVFSFQESIQTTCIIHNTEILISDFLYH